MKERLHTDLVASMKAGTKTKTTLIRAIKTAITMAEKLGKVVGDQEVIAIIRKQMKQREDSYWAFSEAGRTDLADNEKVEIHILQDYLPTSLAVDKVEEMVDSIIKRLDAKTRKDMGRVMGEAKLAVEGKFDGKELSQMVMRKLS
jgi:uncharacterized protein YqeY